MTKISEATYSSIALLGNRVSFETTRCAYEMPDSNIKLVYSILKHSQTGIVDMHYFILKEMITPNISHLTPVSLKITILIFPSNICYRHWNTA